LNSIDFNKIVFDKTCIRFNESFSLIDIDWTLEPGQVWAIMGASGCGKSALASALAGEGDISSGTVTGRMTNVGMVSLESQAALIERERLRDDSDITDRVNDGTPVREMLSETCADPQLLARLTHLFGLETLLDRGFRKLSTGETRKLLLTRALASKPAMLVIDCPFEGLDTQTVLLTAEVLRRLAGELPLVLVINRIDELRDKTSMDLISQLLHLKTAAIKIPAAVPGDTSPSLDSNEPLVDIRKASIRYTDNMVFENLDWRIEPGQHWQLTGPNGSGKTCLLNLITGDHPQCYSNDIFVCGYQRGNGESIWDIKQHIGYVSSALQWDYRVSISCKNVVISGFYDSIGLYAKATDLQQEIALQWLQVLGLQDRAGQAFKQFSYGDQRLLLIARAMVKHPHLLILDEPCFGLDDMNRQLVLALVEKICAGTETTVIYVNHHAQDQIEGIDHYLALGDTGT
jgi:molybdate transport system ATP-binding protein